MRGQGGRRESGVTLMELMIVVAIIGVLATIAYPAYTQFMMQTNRTDATKTMQLAAQALERCYSQNFTYANCPFSIYTLNDGINITSPNNYYNVAVAMPDPQDYTLTGTAIAAPQTADSSCTTFTLSSTGQQSAVDNAANNTTQLCWGSN